MAPKTVAGAHPRDPWKSAFESLSDEGRATFSGVNSNILEDLKIIQQATEDKKRACEEKSWKIYTKKDGQKVTLRHLLEKMSVWVTESMKIVDTFIAFDKSGHAALPWAIIKFVITGGISTIEKFSEMIEHVESVAGLLARYTAMEKLYLTQVCDSTEQLREAIVELYASILTYLAAAKEYFGGGTIKQIGRSVVEMFSHRYEELWNKVSEVQVDKWVAVVAAEMQANRVKDSYDQHAELKDILHRLDQPIMSIAADLSFVKDSLQEADRNAVYRWLSGIKYREHHTTFSKGLLKNSGLWLLQSRKYVQWAQSSLSSTFWLHGKPGAGKTRLTSQVIEQMKASAKPNSCSIAYYYCDRTSPEPGRNKSEKILGTLLRQLASIDIGQPLRPPVVVAYKKYKDDAGGDSSEPQPLSTEGCIDLAKELIRDHQATIMIDAIDECDDEEQYELLRAMDRIITSSEGLVKVFISSRETTFLQDIMRCSPIIDLDAGGNTDDIGRFVEEEIDRLSNDKRLLRGRLVRDKGLRKKTIRTLKAGAQGMFRWVVLSIETLIAINHPKDFEDNLGKLPPKLSGLYDIIFKQIEQAGSHERDVVTKLLNWLLCAQRVLSVAELIYAVSEPGEREAAHALVPTFDQKLPSSGETSADDEAFSDEESFTGDEGSFEHHADTDLLLQPADIVLFCRSLVSHDTAQNTFRFAHQSVREYLIAQEGWSLFQAHSMALELCLWQNERLEADIEEVEYRKSAPITTHPNWEEILNVRRPEVKKQIPEFLLDGTQEETMILVCPRRAAAFVEYSIPFWPVHAQEVLQERARVSQSVFKQALDFLITGDDLAAPFGTWSILARTFTARSHHYKDLLHGFLGKTPAPLFIVCTFGLLSIMENVVFQESVKNWNCRNRDGQTGLIIAASRGYSEIVQLLLKAGSVEVNAQDSSLRTALSWAAENGHELVVQQLLAVEEVDPNLEDLWDRTPLTYAARNGYVAVLSQLVDSPKIDLYSADRDGLWALSTAASEGHVSVVKRLLNLRNIKADYGTIHVQKALACAARGGHESIIKLLLATSEVDVNAHSRGITSLCHAIKAGNLSVIELLFDTGKLDVNARNRDGSTALMYAAEASNEMLVKYLLDLDGIDINARDHDGQTALMWAVIRESISIVRLLLDTGKISLAIRSWLTFTPLAWARKHECNDIIQQLEQYIALHHQTEDVDIDELA